MIVSRRVGALFGALLMSCCATAGGQETAPTRPPSPDASKVLATLVDAFNRHDADAIGQLWTDDAVHIAGDRGDRTEGREAIVSGYRALFKADPQCQLSILAASVQHLADNAVVVDGIADVLHSDGRFTRSEINTTLIDKNGTWSIARVHETDVPVATPAHHALAALDWLLGEWVDTASDGWVKNEVYWSANLNYLIRHYQQAGSEGPLREGTQILAWDADQQLIRSWLFDDSGAFGEGTWEPTSHGQWANKMAVKLSDGRRGSFTQIIGQEGQGGIHLQIVDADIDGQALPNSPKVVLTRMDSARDTEDSTSTGGKSP